MTAIIRRPVGAARLGDHLCLVFASDAEQQQAAATFVRDGLALNEKVIYFTDTAPAKVLSFLKMRGIAVAAAIGAGQLAVHGTAEPYMGHGAPFDPDAMITRLGQIIDTGTEEGYAGVRLTGETPWMLRAGLAPQTLAAYEHQVTDLCAARPASALCPYDWRQFPGDILAAARAAHPLAAIPGPLCETDGPIPYTPGYASPAGIPPFAMPARCPNGHAYTDGSFAVTWEPCPCVTGSKSAGHHTITCHRCLKERQRQPAANIPACLYLGF